MHGSKPKLQVQDMFSKPKLQVQDIFPSTWKQIHKGKPSPQSEYAKIMIKK